MNYGKAEEPSSSPSRLPSTARFAVTSAILPVISSRSDKAPSVTVAVPMPVLVFHVHRLSVAAGSPGEWARHDTSLGAPAPIGRSPPPPPERPVHRVIRLS